MNGLFDASVVLHVHVSKTGGSTLRLQGADVLNRTDCGVNLRCGGLKRTLQLAAATGCVFISHECHVSGELWRWHEQSDRPGFPLPPRAHVVTVLRNPIEQWLSVVRHTYRMIDTSPAGMAEKKRLAASPLGLLSMHNDTQVGRAFGGHDPRNMQTRWLGPTLSAALERINDRRTLVLVNEFYDASMCLLSHAGGVHGTAITDNDHKSIPLAHRESSSLFGLSRTPILDLSRSPIDGMSSSDMTILTGWLADDFMLYAAALRKFHDDVASAERETKQRFLLQRQRHLRRGVQSVADAAAGV